MGRTLLLMQEQPLTPLTKVGLGFLVAATRRRVKQVVWARLAPMALTPQQFWVILVINRKGPQSLHTLAREVWMDDPTASRVVKALCDRGLLHSDPDPAHGRRILIRLTPEGTGMARELETISEEIRVRLAGGLSEEEQAVLRRGLAQMITNMDNLAEELPRPSRVPQRRLKVGNL
ncbi:MarR family transcriptional regulator [Geothrix rubra]|uniref:MarR family transcriptional regulator n=2 Tax=Geothrix rubra TaxID=2927977 RepID=A0ABQ5Q872_9BACT|nr:MarR family transcriptional regulator [Geothrix rubra]